MVKRILIEASKFSLRLWIVVTATSANFCLVDCPHLINVHINIYAFIAHPYRTMRNDDCPIFDRPVRLEANACSSFIPVDGKGPPQFLVIS